MSSIARSGRKTSCTPITLSLSLSLSLPNQAFSWLSHPFEALGQMLKDSPFCLIFHLLTFSTFSQIKIMCFNTALENPLKRTIFAFLLRGLYVILKSWDSITKGISLWSSSTFLRKNIHFAKAQPHSSTPSTSSNQNLTIRSAVQKNTI